MEKGNSQWLRVLFEYPYWSSKYMQCFAETSRFKQIDWVKLKVDLEYCGFVYVEPVRPNVTYQTLSCLKTHWVLWWYLHFRGSLKQKKKFFLSIDKHQNVKKRTISNEIEYGSV